MRCSGFQIGSLYLFDPKVISQDLKNKMKKSH